MIIEEYEVVKLGSMFQSVKEICSLELRIYANSVFTMNHVVMPVRLVKNIFQYDNHNWRS